MHFGGGGNFEGRHRGDVVQSRIDCAVLSPHCGWTGEDSDWLLSDHACIGGSLVVVELGKVDERQGVEWHRLSITLADEDEG